MFNLFKSKETPTETEKNYECGKVSSLKLDILDAECTVERTNSGITTVSAKGHPEFIDMLTIDSVDDTLTVSHKIFHNYNFHGVKNYISIYLACDEGKNVRAAVDGSGSIELGQPFDYSKLIINGSGRINAKQTVQADTNINGSGEIHMTEAANLNVHINGSGTVKIKNVTQSAEAHIQGSGDVHIGSGEMESMKIAINGGGNIDARECVVGDLNVSINGGGNIRLARVTGAIRKVINGGGNIRVGE